MHVVLGDPNTCRIMEKNPIKKIENTLNDKRWSNKGHMEDKVLYRLRSSDKLLPKAYGVSKSHKDNNPLRIIVSCVNTPLYNLVVFLHDIIKNALPTARSHIDNSFELYKKLTGSRIKSNDILISLDVVSLFTNVLLDLALNSINNRWSYISKITKIPKFEFTNAIKFILSSTVFNFDNKAYEQTFGTSMGSPLSPIVADLVLQDIENKALHKVSSKITFYYRYVDDIFLATESDMIDHIVDTFNSFHERLQFTYEIENERRLRFLDLEFIVNNNSTIMIDWYHKKTFSGRYLSFLSHHPLCHKIGTVFSLTDRCLLLSDPCFHQKNLEFAINTLVDNLYPLSFIFKHIHKRIKWIINKQTHMMSMYDLVQHKKLKNLYRSHV